MLKKTAQTALFWLRNARGGALFHSFFPTVLALTMAGSSEGFSLLMGLIALVGVFSAHMSVNLLDDYFDYINKSPTVREDLVHRGIRARLGKCEYLTSNSASVKQLKTVITVLGCFALTCGVIIFLFRGVTVLILLAIAAILGISYSGGPLKLSYRGLGGLAILLLFGPLLMMGVYFSAAGVLDFSVIFVSISTGLLVVNAGHIHDIMDFEPDKEVGKMTFSVLLGSKRAMLIALVIILACIFGAVAAGVFTGFLSSFYLFVFLSLPLAVALYWMTSVFVHEPDREFAPAPWMGPMPGWAQIKEAGIDWFMIRWYLARNLQTLFCLLLIASSLIVLASGR
ncbi:MAG: prenyltransferase [Treponema sp.]|nr:prenyltransferase [Treponema sp.]